MVSDPDQIFKFFSRELYTIMDASHIAPPPIPELPPLKGAALEYAPFGHLFSVIHRQSSVAMTRRLRESGVSFGQFLSIRYIYENEGCSQEQLSNRLRLDKGAVARTVHALEEDGYVQRLPDPQDRRRMILSLTDRGKEQYRTIIRISDEWETVLLQALSPDEQQELRRLLVKVVQSLN